MGEKVQRPGRNAEPRKTQHLSIAEKPLVKQVLGHNSSIPGSGQTPEDPLQLVAVVQLVLRWARIDALC
jgi:hypothetical protein